MVKILEYLVFENEEQALTFTQLVKLLDGELSLEVVKGMESVSTAEFMVPDFIDRWRRLYDQSFLC